MWTRRICPSTWGAPAGPRCWTTAGPGTTTPSTRPPAWSGRCPTPTAPLRASPPTPAPPPAAPRSASGTLWLPRGPCQGPLQGRGPARGRGRAPCCPQGSCGRCLPPGRHTAFLSWPPPSGAPVLQAACRTALMGPCACPAARLQMTVSLMLTCPQAFQMAACRDSKLSHILQDFLGGNCLTILCIYAS